MKIPDPGVLFLKIFLTTNYFLDIITNQIFYFNVLFSKYYFLWNLVISSNFLKFLSVKLFMI